MNNEVFDQGLTLMLVGMGTVFVFLSVLVASMSIMSLLIRKWTPAATIKTSTDASHEEVAAISAALAKHRQK